MIGEGSSDTLKNVVGTSIKTDLVEQPMDTLFVQGGVLWATLSLSAAEAVSVLWNDTDSTLSLYLQDTTQHYLMFH